MMNSEYPFQRIAKNSKVWIFLLSAAALIWLAFAYFSNVIVYLLIAFVISMIGKPLVNFFEKRLRIPNTWSCVLVLLIFTVGFGLFFWLIMPLIARQAENISQIDFYRLGEELSVLLSRYQEEMWQLGLLKEGQTVDALLMDNMKSIISSVHFDLVFTNILGFLSSLFMGVFSIIFVSFFFLKDQNLFHQMLMIFVPTDYEKQAENIIQSSRVLLSRYFVGLLAEVVTMMTLLSAAMAIMGVKNALLLGFIGGLLNVIPYLGPVIGTCIASALAYTTALSGGYTPDLIWVVVKIVVAFSACNLVDNLILQPVIYSNSVKAHPLEIFIVILMAGTLAGVVGMILAIPVYTLARIIAKEFFMHSKLVNKLTQKL